MENFSLIISDTGRKMVMHYTFPQFVVVLEDKASKQEAEVKYLDDLPEEITISDLYDLFFELKAWMAKNNLEM